MTLLLRAAAVQMQHVPGDKAANLRTVDEFCRAAAAQEVRLICFPECCLSGYWHLRKLSRDELLHLAEPVPEGACTHRLLELAAELQMTIGAGFIERTDGGELFNAYVVTLPDGTVHCHRKLHAFVSEHLSSGERYTVFDLPGGPRAGVLTCYDNNIVENARITALLGAEVLLAPHQTGGCRSRSPHGMKPINVELWENRSTNPAPLAAAFAGDNGRGWLMRWLPARAHDNGMFILFANGVGRDDDEVRTGHAMILDPYGRIVAESRALEDDLVIADLDLSLVAQSTGRRWLRSRRPELYSPIVTPTGQEQPTRAVRFE